MKNHLRKKMMALRRAIPEPIRQEKSRKIREKLFSLSEWQRAQRIMSYVSFGSEVDTHQVIKQALAQGKRVAVPLCIPQVKGLMAVEIEDFPGDLVPGTMGILEPKPDRIYPVDPESLDLILVPGVAFDRSRHRLGYGAGYYDRFLSGLRRPKAIGLAFQEQVVERIAKEGHDRPVDLIITDEEVI
ncbi:MAG TPA: 5-formyltetrahydrofolate cyclo-ligase [Moorella mulderi]|nr:5-formyltetrahydrofolate cyclo-ligase [Moorella mulderi]